MTSGASNRALRLGISSARHLWLPTAIRLQIFQQCREARNLFGGGRSGRMAGSAFFTNQWQTLRRVDWVQVLLTPTCSVGDLATSLTRRALRQDVAGFLAIGSRAGFFQQIVLSDKEHEHSPQETCPFPTEMSRKAGTAG